MKRKLVITYQDKSTESFNNIKDETTALNIVKGRINVKFAEYKRRLIFGTKPAKKLKVQEKPMSLADMERLISRM